MKSTTTIPLPEARSCRSCMSQSRLNSVRAMCTSTIMHTTMNGSNSSSNTISSKCTRGSLIMLHSAAPPILTSDMTSRNTTPTICFTTHNFMISIHPCTMNHFNFPPIHLNPITYAIPNQLNSRTPPLSFHHSLASLPTLFTAITTLVFFLRELVVQSPFNTLTMPQAKRHSISDGAASIATPQSHLHGVARR